LHGFGFDSKILKFGRAGSFAKKIMITSLSQNSTKLICHKDTKSKKIFVGKPKLGKPAFYFLYAFLRIFFVPLWLIYFLAILCRPSASTGC